jgi:taurine dioxygenase
MTSITSLKVRPLADELPFGATVEGVDLAALGDEAVRAQLRQVFEDRGVIVFKNMAQDSELHLTLSEVFGPLQHHPLYVDDTKKPTVIDLDQKQDVIRANGELLAAFLPWHFDACYTAKLNRAAVLRPVAIPPEGGWTGFADGIQLYNAISPELRGNFEDAKILYHAKLMFMHQKFGFPVGHEWVSISDSAAGSIEKSENARRSVHPAIWQRASGEKVLHVSPWQASGIYGNETPEGDALLAQLCNEIYAKMTPYWHRWEMSDMVLWDNVRFIHAVNGNDPRYARHMQRATIEGDYGFGCFEPGVEGDEPPVMG